MELDGLKALGIWVNQARQENQEELLTLSLRVLESLPVTLQALRSCVIGKIVNKLKAHSTEGIANKSSQLVKKWMGIVDSAAEEKVKARNVFLSFHS